MKTMLIVDDSMLTRMMVNTIVSTHYPDWNIIMAVDAADALTKVSDIDFDIATIDMNMPGISGLELIKKLQISHPKAKLALLTANIQRSIANEAESLNIALLSKPVNEELIKQYLGDS